jgi:KDO2-lipid IV(A) lauroyltransferase
MGILYRFIYYFILKPLSFLPFWALQRMSDFLYYIMYYLVGFRKKVVYQNLSNSFPEKNNKEIIQIAKKFYRHLCDLIVESVKLFSISREEVINRCKFVNPELLDFFYEQNRSIIIVAGHYNNWEIFAQSCNLQMKHQAVGIYTPLTNPYFEKKFSASRGRYKVVLLQKNDVKEYFRTNSDQLLAVVFGTDQSPSSGTKRVYWTTFLNQETAVMYGSEKYAREYNFPVIFARMIKVKRGSYEIRFELLEENPATSDYGVITEKHTRALEKQILEQPEFWLWTHRRWKRKKSDFLSLPAEADQG